MAILNARIHITKEIRAPFRGPLSDIVPGCERLVLMLLGVPPTQHEEGEVLRIIVDGSLLGEHSLSWLMDFYALNAHLVKPGSPSDALCNAFDVVTQLNARAVAEWKNIDLSHVASTMQNLAAACEKFYAIAGVRLARAIPMRSTSHVEIVTSCDSVVRCYLGGLASIENDDT